MSQWTHKHESELCAQGMILPCRHVLVPQAILNAASSSASGLLTLDIVLYACEIVP